MVAILIKKSDLRNTGITANMRGGMVGSDLLESPEGNSYTNLSKLENDVRQDLMKSLFASVGKDDSSHINTHSYIGRICSGDLDANDVASTKCEWVDHRIPLYKGRISFQKHIGF